MIYLGKSYGIIGDGGFTFNPKGVKEKILGLGPFRRNKEFNDEKKDFNRGLSEIRVVIENVNNKLKNWRILDGKYRHSIQKDGFIDIQMVFRACCILTQISIMRKNLRKEGWKPKSSGKIKKIPKK